MQVAGCRSDPSQVAPNEEGGNGGCKDPEEEGQGPPWSSCPASEATPLCGLRSDPTPLGSAQAAWACPQIPAGEGPGQPR